MRIENGGKEQYYQQEIDDIGKGVVEPVIQHDNDKTQDDTGSYPDDLHTRTGREAEDVCFAIRVTGTAHANPPERQQGDIEQYRPPVNGA
jgi:hypothetical protein